MDVKQNWLELARKALAQHKEGRTSLTSDEVTFVETKKGWTKFNIQEMGHVAFAKLKLIAKKALRDT